MIMSKNIKMPQMFSLVRGSTQLSSELEAINQSIKLVLTTSKGELFGDPDFGTDLYTFIYDYEGEALNQLIKDEIVTCLNEQCPRIYVTSEDITIQEEDKTLHITISYHIRYSDYTANYSMIIQSRQEVA